MNRRRLGLAGLAALACLSQRTTLSAAPAEPAEHAKLRRFSGPHAFTLPKGRIEFGLFRTSRYGAGERWELGVHPIAFFALPHIELKHRVFETRELALAVRYRLSYPTAFLGLVSREGSGGLLPANSEPPFALQLEGDGVVSYVWQRRQIASVALGLAVAPHASFTPEALPLLDFPFLYPRFAPVYTAFVPRGAANFEGPLAGSLYYAVDLRVYVMPDLPEFETAAALEQGLALEYRFGDRAGISAGLLASEAEYPVGFRVHFLPYLDARVGF